MLARDPDKFSILVKLGDEYLQNNVEYTVHGVFLLGREERVFNLGTVHDRLTDSTEIVRS